MSAPHSMGRTSAGEAEVLSITSGSLCSMGNLRQLLDVGDVELGIAQRLGVNGSGLVVDQPAQTVEVVGVDKLHLDAQPRQRVVEQIVGAAVKRRGGDDLVARRGQRRDRQRLGRLA